MKTIFIWDSCGDESIKFFIIKGDFSRLNHTYINSIDKQIEQDELNTLMYNTIEDKPKITMLDEFPVHSLSKGDVVITCGYYP